MFCPAFRILAIRHDLRSINHISLLSVKTNFNVQLAAMESRELASAGIKPMQRRAAAQTIEPQDFLLPDPIQRRKPAVSVRPALIEDAVFEVVAPGPRHHGRTNDNPPQKQPAGRSDLLPMLARIGGRLAAATEQRLARLSPQAFMALLSSLAILVFWICGGFSALSFSAAVDADRPFALVDTSIRTQDANGMKLAVVTGSVRNTSGRIIAAPRLAVVGGAHQDIIGTVVLPVDRIGPGVTIPFAGRFKLAGGKSADLAIIPEHP